MVALGRFLTAWLVGLAVFVCANAALAKGQVAVHVEGAKADEYREMIVSVLPDGLTAIDEADFSAALRRSGLRGPMGYAVSSPGSRSMLVRVIKKAVASAEVEAAIVARVAAGRGGLEMTVLVVDENDLVDEDKIPLKGDSGEQEAALADALGPTLASYAPASEPQPEPDPTVEDEPTEPVEEGEDDEEEEEDDEPSNFRENRPGGELFNVGVGVELGGRFLRYPPSMAATPTGEVDVNSNNLRPFDIFGAPGIVVAGAIYPAATLDIPFLSDLGLVAEYMHAFGLSSQTSDGIYLFSTKYNRFEGGLRYRFRIDDESDFPFVIGASAKMGFVHFILRPENPASADIADEVGTVKYLFVRPGLDMRLPLADWFALEPSFAYLATLEGGEAYDRFREASVHGIDAGLMLAFPLALGIETRAGANYVRYFSSFAPEPGDPYVAGGAVDQFVMLRAGVAYVY